MKYLFLYFFSAFALFAQVQEELKVTVREMRVHVIDKDGFPVKGLGPNYFSLKSKSQAIDLSYFEEVNLMEAVETKPSATDSGDQDLGFAISDNNLQRNVVLFVDSSHLTKKNFETVKTTLRDFIRDNLSPKDRLSIFHWDEEVTEIAGFYKSRDAALASIDDMKFVGRMRREMLKAQRAIDSEIKEWDVLENPELRYSYENSINQLIRQKAQLKSQHYRTFYLNMLSVAYTLEQMSGPKSIFLFTGGSYLEVSGTFGATTSLSEKLGRVLNRANATIYTIMVKATNPIGGNPPFLQNQSPSFTNQFKRSSDFPPSEMGSPDVALNTIAEDNKALESGPAAAADQTGGLFLKTFNDSQVAEQLAQVQNVSSHYYRFAFDVQDAQRPSKMKVSLKDKQRGWKLLYGSDVEESVPYEKLDDEERQIALTSMLLYGSKYRDDFNTSWDAKIFEQGENGYRIAMMGSFERPKPFSKGLEIGFVALDKERSLLDMTTSVVTKAPAGDKFSFYDVLLTDKEPHYLRFYARNLANGDYAIHEIKTDYRPGDGKTQMSDILMDQPGDEMIISLNQLSFVKQGGETAPERIVQRSELDPFWMEDKVYAPGVAPYSFNRGVVGFMFHLENPEDPNKVNYQVAYLVKSESGFQKVPGRVIASWQDPLGNIHFQGQIKTDELKKGPYALYVRVLREDTQENYTKQVSFELN